MKRGYIRGRSPEDDAEQAAALKAFGVVDHAVMVEELPRTLRRHPSAADLTDRDMAVSQCRRGDRLCVASLPVLALNVPDFIAVMTALAEKGAAVLDVSDGSVYQWREEALDVADAIAKFESLRKSRQTKPGRAAIEAAKTRKGFRVGRLPKLTPKQRAEAEPLWRDLTLSGSEVAKRFKCSASTLYNEFGPRTDTKRPRRQRQIKRTEK